MNDISRKFCCSSLLVIFFLVFFNVGDAQKNYKETEQKLDFTIDTAYANYNVPGVVVVSTPKFIYSKVIGKADMKIIFS